MIVLLVDVVVLVIVRLRKEEGMADSWLLKLDKLADCWELERILLLLVLHLLPHPRQMLYETCHGLGETTLRLTDKTMSWQTWTKSKSIRGLCIHEEDEEEDFTKRERRTLGLCIRGRGKKE